MREHATASPELGTNLGFTCLPGTRPALLGAFGGLKLTRKLVFLQAFGVPLEYEALSFLSGSLEAIEVIAKPNFDIILSLPRSISRERITPLFLKGGRGD